MSSIDKGSSNGSEIMITVAMMVLLFGAFSIAALKYNPQQQTVVKSIELKTSEGDLCETIGSLSSVFMTNRQFGVSIEDARKNYMQANPPKKIQDLVEYILIKAYESPIVEDKVNAVMNFSGTYINSCYHSLFNTEKFDMI